MGGVNTPWKKIPLLGPSLRHYDRRLLSKDILAGVTVAAITIPAALAYAQLAGLPAIYGLYASIIPTLVFSLIASSRQQIIGPDATLSLVIASVLAAVAGSNPQKAATVAPMLGVMVGILLLAMGIARLGFMAAFLSRSLLIGFVSGMSIEIFIGQLPKMLGYSVDATGSFQTLIATVQHIAQTNWISLVFAISCAVILFAVTRWSSRIPIALVLIVVSIIIASALDIHSKGVATLGEVPSGLPPFVFPFTSFNDVGAMFTGALAIVLIGFADQSLEAKVWAAQGGYDVDANRDLIALGSANILGSFTSSYPVGSSGSRTAAGINSGGRSGMMGVTAAAVIAITVVFLAPFLKNLPQPVLGAIVAVTALSLFDLAGLKNLKKRPHELTIAIITLVGVVVLGVLPGVAIAVVISLLDVIRRVSMPHDAVLGQRPGRPGYFDVERNDDLDVDTQTIDGLLIYRFDAPLFFANADRFRARLKELAKKDVHWIIVDASAISDVDATAADVLDRLFDDFAKRGITVAFAGAMGKLRDRLRSHKHGGLVPEGMIFKTLDEAIETYKKSHTT